MFPNSEDVVPRLLKPLYWTFFVPREARPFALIIASSTYLGISYYVWPCVRELLLTTNFFQGASFQPGVPHLMYLKEKYAAQGGAAGNSAKLHGTNHVFKLYLKYFGKSYMDVGDLAHYFGGGRRPGHPAAAGDPFSWIHRPSLKRTALYQRLTGKSQPTQFSYAVQEWAQDLRSLLPNFGVKAISAKFNALSYFLVYLSTLGDEAPATWWQLDRAVHINGGEGDDGATYVNFLSQLPRRQVKRCLLVLKQAWELAAARDGTRGKYVCPIDLDGDAPGKLDEHRLYRTKRRAMDPDVYSIIADEHRRDNFAFAKSLELYTRTVRDSSGAGSNIFWPAVPMILDNILIYGMRGSSSRWQDSGEGDESWINTDRRVVEPNPLPSRTVGRAKGFLQLFRIGPRTGDDVIGMHIATGKTGPRSVPFVEPETIRYFRWMRDLQILHNPIPRPIVASRDQISIKINRPGTYDEVFPLYREYGSVTGHPPTMSAVHNYWNKLLEHCQPIVNQKLGRIGDSEVILAINGKACWDLHSLRVSTVTTLLENDVPPWMVAELVGHMSLAMLYHYWARDGAKVHAALSNAIQARLGKLRRAINNSKDGAQIEETLRTHLGGLYFLRDDNIGIASLRSAVRDYGSTGYELFGHGICPGGDCKTGGPILKNQYQPVWRDRACSRCRWRVTGPAFLLGLVHRLNSLMVELKASLDKEADLNREIESLGDDSGGADIIRGHIRSLREARENLWSEWCAELKTIEQCINLLEGDTTASRAALLVNLPLDEYRQRLKQVHQLALFQDVIMGGQLIPGAALEVPHGLRERRDAILLEIGRVNNLNPFFYSLEPELRKRTLDAFCDLLLAHVGEDTMLQEIVEGHRTIEGNPRLDLLVHEMIARVRKEAAISSAPEAWKVIQ